MEVKDGGRDGEKMKRALGWRSEGGGRPSGNRQGTEEPSFKKTEAFDVHGSKPGVFFSLHPEEFRDPGTTLLWWRRGASWGAQFVNHPDKASPRTTQEAPGLTGAARGLGGPGRGGLSGT